MLYNKGKTTLVDYPSASGNVTLALPASVKSIGDYAFHERIGLTSITIPEGITSIGSSTFSSCRHLTSVNIPPGVTTINSSTFSGCESLTSITIPASVTSIGRFAFSNCGSLTEVICLPTTPPTLETTVFDSTLYSQRIKVPAASVNTYKAADNWSDYASRIIAISG
jgi:hypothetical protein